MCPKVSPAGRSSCSVVAKAAVCLVVQVTTSRLYGQTFQGLWVSHQRISKSAHAKSFMLCQFRDGHGHKLVCYGRAVDRGARPLAL